jgi:anti-anti-sigma regulatory factor
MSGSVDWTEVLVRRNGSVSHLELVGEIDLEYGWVLDEALDHLGKAGATRLVIDAGRCSFLDFTAATAIRRACEDELRLTECSVRGASGVVRRVMALADWPRDWFATGLAPVIPLDRHRPRATGTG